ncbi:MAG: hypothetical protein M1829_000169 [Trizodia sp. TS-e1964]|nr:MAG: hypothetical protein M1829_000169 [Trizodia sp. TS-e1964]
MAKHPPFHMFKETRLSFESPSLASTIILRLPAHGVPNHRTSFDKALIYEPAIAEDETSYSRINLASSASVYFRQGHKYPRGFLWRVLGDSKVLSLQSIDLSRSPQEKHEASLTLRLHFPQTIRPGGVAFSDPEDHDVLCVFVLTNHKELYTLTLRPEYFCRASASESTIGDWCKSFIPGCFSFRYPHRLHPLNPHELLISLHDGGILKLTRPPNSDGSFWTETFYNDGSWGGTLRGLIPWQGNGTVRYANTNLEQATVTSMARSPLRLLENGRDHVFAVTLNHTIKAWNLETGKIDVTKDLLNVERQPQEMGKYLIDPSQAHLIYVLDHMTAVLHDFILITYSPIGAGQFKLWGVRSDNIRTQIDDLYPDHVFEPVPPSAEIWTLSQFSAVILSESRMMLWMLWKNNLSYRVQSLEFDLGDDFPTTWAKSWTTSATQSLRDIPLPSPSIHDPLGATDKWTEFLFYPGRFSIATLETCLSIYQQGLRTTPLPQSPNPEPLEERIAASVASTVALGRNFDGSLDYEHFRVDTDAQWRRFFRIAVELEKQCEEALSLVYDVNTGLPWMVSTGGAAVVRECSHLELLWHNRFSIVRTNSDDFSQRPTDFHHIGSKDGKTALEMAGLIHAAAMFRESFSDALDRSCATAYESEIFQDPSYSPTARLRSFYDRCNFAGEISDDTYSQLLENIAIFGGFETIDNEMFIAILKITTGESGGQKSRLNLTSFGAYTLSRCTQDSVLKNSSILFDLLILVVFMDIEVDRDEEENQLNFDAPEIFVALLSLLRKYEVFNWLAKTKRSDDSMALSTSPEDSPKRSKTKEPKSQTLLEDLYVVPWRPLVPHHSQRQSQILTHSIEHIIRDADVSSDPAAVVTIQCYLLREGKIECATDFLRFQPSTPWATYIKARYYVCIKDYTAAAIHFKKCAHSFAAGKACPEPEQSDMYLTQIDVDNLNGGFPRYYRHVAEIFEREKAYSYVVSFARLGLQFCGASALNAEVQKDLLLRIFSSSLFSSRFDEAYSALMQYPGKDIQSNDLRKLIITMCQQNESSRLLALPFPGLHTQVDEILLSKCLNTLTLSSGPPFHQILYAWRLHHGDFRGAASILYNRLQRQRTASTLPRARDGENSPLIQGYLALINLLASVDESQAWILSTARVEEPENQEAGAKRAKGMAGVGGAMKRSVVTLADIRREYSAELDRLAMIQNNQFALEGGDAMDVL